MKEIKQKELYQKIKWKFMAVNMTKSWMLDTTTCILQSKKKATSNGSFQGDNPLDFSLPLIILQIVVVVAVTRIISYIFKPLRQPRVVAEIIGGVLLGPSGMGRSTVYMNTIFPDSSMINLDTIENIGLLFFLFLVGLELDLRAFRHTGKKTILIAIVESYILALVVSLSGSGSPLISLLVFLCRIGFVVFATVVICPFIIWLAFKSPNGEKVKEIHICITLLKVLVGGFNTDMIGIHALFGAFIIGIIIPKKGPLAGGLVEIIVLNIGKDRGVLNDESFAILVTMALFTTFITHPGSYGSFQTSTGPSKVLTSKTKSSRGMLRRGITMYFMHLMDLSEIPSDISLVNKARRNNGLPFWNNRRSKGENVAIAVAFKSFDQLNHVKIRSMMVISDLVDIHEDIVDSSQQKCAALIILPFHKYQRFADDMESLGIEFLLTSEPESITSRHLFRRDPHRPWPRRIISKKRMGTKEEVIVELKGLGKFNIILVGRMPPIKQLDDRSDCNELGPIGSYMTSQEFSTTASVLVIQQYCSKETEKLSFRATEVYDIVESSQSECPHCRQTRLYRWS
ncbi:hypothetical protein ZOSMA_176G00140 [Zostera marina]|uniref:Uncharacterized protein n=1 Tax=Zostera marina TaxID=29655 RepID=A0A0K9PRY4_ZOSMR|nr:hypothetical protein ZOSMA_176G00140 [Zostera marina]